MLGQALNPVLLEHSAELYHYARAACNTRHYKCILYQSIPQCVNEVYHEQEAASCVSGIT